MPIITQDRMRVPTSAEAAIAAEEALEAELLVEAPASDGRTVARRPAWRRLAIIAGALLLVGVGLAGAASLLRSAAPASAAAAAGGGVQVLVAKGGKGDDSSSAAEPSEESFWMDKCSWSGDESCLETKCCNNQDYQCYRKNEYYAGCQEKPPPDWEGTLLGGFRAWEVPKAPAGQCAGSSLWCITVVSTDEEQGLLDAQSENGVGIFQCDAHTVFKGAFAPMGEWKSIANTDVFIDVWEKQIKVDETWKKYDWTVKVDIDLVFFPDRLKWHIEALCAPKDTAIFLKNIDFKWGFLGSLEVFSNEAMRVYSKVGWKCSEHIGHNSGEDGYMKACMDAIGAGYMTDYGLLDDKYTRGGFSGWGPGDCASGSVVGFHPFKTEWVWESCHDASRRNAGDSGFKCLAMGCDQR